MMNLKEMGIETEVKYGGKELGYFEDNWKHDTWTVTFTKGTKMIEKPYYMGIGNHGREPKPEEVMQCLIQDARSYTDTQNFKEFAREFGYSDDSIRALKIFKACKRTYRELEKFFGNEDFLNWELED
jgi:hypothetical protein